MLNWLFRNSFKLRGWKVVGDVPINVRKAIFAVAPHKYYAPDFLLGLCSRAVLHRNIGFLGKAELFKPPFGWFFKAMGGTPVVRTKNNNQVQNVIDTFNKHDDLLIAVAPEGTRKNVEKLRTGFYYMAHGANVPIIMVGFDYANKHVIYKEPFMPSGNFEEDMKKYFLPFFKTIHGSDKNWIKNYEAGNFGVDKNDKKVS